MMKIRWPEAYKVIETLEKAGFEAYVVGGAVRDFIRNMRANDVDVTTNATPNEVKQLFPHTIDVGIEHGTVLVVFKEPVEVTTYRSEATYSDFRRPDEVIFVRSLREDLQRRDFTMNAMALSKSDELIDYFGGREDIEKEMIQAVGDPYKRFAEDALRMLRAVRFSAQLNFSLHIGTLKAIQSLHHLIAHVSMERVKVELEKIWASDFVAKGMDLFVTSRLAENFQGDWKTNKKSWEHFSSFCNNANGWAFFALFQSPTEVNSLLTLYKCSNAEKMHVKNVLHAVDQLKKGHWTPYDFFQFDEEVLIPAASYAGQLLHMEVPYTIENIRQAKASLPISSVKEIVINGNDLMEWTKIKRGPWIREVLERIIVMVVNGQLVNEREQVKQWFFREYIHGE
ncbi:CCA tRNA nucleotidyltransferase [Bacillus sp. FJAT-22090]|uniref:CCA tRNA nucleotidyltransferase n=1 Tax=Bacillus sp. FJAT-22090 TaxID=1581038 RepID=UPI0016434BF8|nr:CCA tRNA nucleotidyltransferase [Bacillus sp. FJAT-22090]